MLEIIENLRKVRTEGDVTAEVMTLFGERPQKAVLALVRDEGWKRLKSQLEELNKFSLGDALALNEQEFNRRMLTINKQLERTQAIIGDIALAFGKGLFDIDTNNPATALKEINDRLVNLIGTAEKAGKALNDLFSNPLLQGLVLAGSAFALSNIGGIVASKVGGTIGTGIGNVGATISGARTGFTNAQAGLSIPALKSPQLQAGANIGSILAVLSGVLPGVIGGFRNARAGIQPNQYANIGKQAGANFGSIFGDIFSNSNVRLPLTQVVRRTITDFGIRIQNLPSQIFGGIQSSLAAGNLGASIGSIVSKFGVYFFNVWLIQQLLSIIPTGGGKNLGDRVIDSVVNFMGLFDGGSRQKNLLKNGPKVTGNISVDIMESLLSRGMSPVEAGRLLAKQRERLELLERLKALGIEERSGKLSLDSEARQKFAQEIVKLRGEELKTQGALTSEIIRQQIEDEKRLNIQKTGLEYLTQQLQLEKAVNDEKKLQGKLGSDSLKLFEIAKSGPQGVQQAQEIGKLLQGDTSLSQFFNTASKGAIESFKKSWGDLLTNLQAEAFFKGENIPGLNLAPGVLSFGQRFSGSNIAIDEEAIRTGGRLPGISQNFIDIQSQKLNELIGNKELNMTSKDYINALVKNTESTDELNTRMDLLISTISSNGKTAWSSRPTNISSDYIEEVVASRAEKTGSRMQQGLGVALNGRDISTDLWQSTYHYGL
jgi:hypothetical protein